MNILMLDEDNYLEENPELVKIIEDATRATLEYEKFPLNVEVSVTITDNEIIKEINLEHRGIDKETDVLSFPQIDWDYEEIDYKEYENLDTGDIILGDIVLSLERAKWQAKEYGHSLNREVGFLTAHSMLHLLGYDHMEEDEERDMIRRQEDIMEMLGLIR